VALPKNPRFETGLVLTTLALCAFFLSQGVTTLVGAKVLGAAPTPEPRRPTAHMSTTGKRVSRDPAIILRRNIFNSALGDLMQLPGEEGEQVDGQVVLDPEQGPPSCTGEMKLIGTAVIPDDFERSVAMIEGSSGKNALLQGSAEVDGSRIRAIFSNSVILQAASGGLCELVMFEPGMPKKPHAAATPEKKPAQPSTDENGVPTPKEIRDGIRMIDPTSVHIKRTLFSKIFQHYAKLRGSAEIKPKMDRGKLGLEFRRVRSDNVIHKLGIRNGDIVQKINGEQLRAEHVGAALMSLRTADKFTVAVTRNGQSLNIRYNIE